MRILFTLVILASLVDVQIGHAQQKEKLNTEGFGSLSGTVTLVGAIPEVVNLVPKMAMHTDKACCLAKDAKEKEKIDRAWVVNPKNKGVANVVVWVKPPAGKYFDIHPKFKVRKETILIDQPHCAFLPYVSAYNPVYFDGKEMVKTGQELIIRNSAAVGHNVRMLGDGKKNDGFNRNLPPMTELNVTTDKSIKLVPQLMPLPMQCDVHTWMAAKLYVFDHPYYAITDADGKYEIPYVPAGAEIVLMAHHGDAGWVLTKKGEFKAGRPITIKAGEKTTINLTIVK